MQLSVVAFNDSARNSLMTVVFESNSECWCRTILFTLKLVFCWDTFFYLILPIWTKFMALWSIGIEIDLQPANHKNLKIRSNNQTLFVTPQSRGAILSLFTVAVALIMFTIDWSKGPNYFIIFSFKMLPLIQMKIDHIIYSTNWTILRISRCFKILTIQLFYIVYSRVSGKYLGVKKCFILE